MKRLCLVLVLTAPAILLPLALEGTAGGASGSPVVIDFENLPAPGLDGTAPPVAVTDQYASRGVTFNGPQALDYSRGQLPIAGFAHSGTKAIEPCYTPPPPPTTPPPASVPGATLVTFPVQQQACPTLSLRTAFRSSSTSITVSMASRLMRLAF